MPEPSPDRAERVVEAVRAHADAIRTAPLGALRITWSDGSMKVVLESHYPPEPDSKAKQA